MRRRTLVAATGAAVSLGLTPFVWSADDGASTSADRLRPTGAAVFVARGCAMCHEGPERNSSFDAGPSLAAASDWAAERRPGMDAEEYIAESIRHPSAFISPEAMSGGPFGPVMPDLQLDDDEIDVLVDHLLER